jgi:hypothetical protein
LFTAGFSKSSFQNTHFSKTSFSNSEVAVFQNSLACLKNSLNSSGSLIFLIFFLENSSYFLIQSSKAVCSYSPNHNLFLYKVCFVQVATFQAFFI